MFKLQFLENFLQYFCKTRFAIFLTSLYIWLNGLLFVLHLLVCLFTLFLYILCLYLFFINLPFLVNKSFIIDPTTTGVPWYLTPSLRYYRHLRLRNRGVTVLSPQSPLPCSPFYRDVAFLGWYSTLYGARGSGLFY